MAIISDRLWRERFGSRRDVLGQAIVLNAMPCQIVGIAPRGFEHPGNMYHAVIYGDAVDVWIPFVFGNPNDRGGHFMDVLGRLRPNVSPGAAQGELNAVMAQLAHEHPDGDSGWKVMAIPLLAEIVGKSRQMLYVLLGAVGLLLLLACVNAANLLLARAATRRREIAVRAAVGAPRKRVVRQLLTESIALSLIGAALGAFIAVVGVKALGTVLPADFPRSHEIHVDLSIFLFTFLLALVTGILFGAIPAIQGSRVDLRDSLHEGGRSSTSSHATIRLRNILVVIEVTLACVLLIGASLMLRSFVNLLRSDPGFRADHVLTAGITLPQARYNDSKAVALFYQNLLRNLRSIPGVTATGATTDLPWTGWDDNAGGFLIQGETPPPKQDFHARYHAASPDYFRALGIPIIRGREFDSRDTSTSQLTFIINEAMARYWHHGDPLGGKVTFDEHPKDKDWFTIVGIVRDIKDTPKDEAAKPAFWWASEQQPFPLLRMASIAVRSNSNAAALAPDVRSAVRALDMTLALSDLRTMDVVAGESYSTTRFAFVLVAAFAVLAVLLAAIGTYGVIAYSVNQRIHEFGIRMALGASRYDVLKSVLGGGMSLALVGAALGALFGAALSRLLGDLLYGVLPTDPLAISAACAVALLMACFACVFPARRATMANPMSALRAD